MKAHFGAVGAAALACGVLFGPLPHALALDFMDCSGAPLCGVLTLETGLGSGAYEHDTPVLHGLWPEVGSFGSSPCKAPRKSSAQPEQLYPCYATGASKRRQLTFERHEWKKHGQCAGVQDAEDYFVQACSLARGPLRVMTATRDGGMHALPIFARQLESAGYPVFATNARTMQVELAACADSDGRWTLAKPSEFSTRCGRGAAASQGDVERGSSAEAAQCLRNQRGPRCASDADCGFSGCVRCARTGFCTDQMLRPPSVEGG